MCEVVIVLDAALMTPETVPVVHAAQLVVHILPRQ
jgi:hypothetical protein